MLFGALGDIHGDFISVRRVLARHPDIPFWLCVGDVGDDSGIYEPADAPIYWIKGNNESFDRVGRGGICSVIIIASPSKSAKGCGPSDWTRCPRTGSPSRAAGCSTRCST